MRRARRYPAARRAHGDRPRLRLPGALARADHVLHHGGSLARPPWRRARAQRASRALRRDARRLARPGLGERGRGCATCAASSPARWSSSAPPSGSAPACRPRSRSLSPSGWPQLVRDVDLAELCITSAAVVRARPGARRCLHPARCGRISAFCVAPAPGERCERCWRVLPEVGQVPGHSDLCRRCATVVEPQGAPARVASAG